MTAQPPSVPPPYGTRRRSWRAVIAVGTVMLVLAVYYAVTPDSGFYPRCLFLQLTGWECPGCGSQRAIHALMHGDWAGAWSYNRALPFLVALMVVAGAVSVIPGRFPRLHRMVSSRAGLLAVLALIVAWTVARNVIPGL